jgi:hypothetical protein
MFGTFQEELKEEPVRYGLTKPLPPTNNPVKLVMHEWIAMGKDLKKKTSLLNKIKYMIKPPGWSHDGSSQTSIELRAALNNQMNNKQNNS